MTRLLFALLFSLLSTPVLAEAVEWAEGRWFDGTTFVAGTRWSVDGVMTLRRPKAVDRTVNLANRYIVPAFGDAHHHGIDSIEALDDKVHAFLEAGIFFVKNPNAIADLLTPEVRAKVNRPGSIDVAFANGGLTSTGGHPAPLHAYLASIGVFKGLKPEDMENRAYFFLDEERDIEAKWPRIVASKPDFLKAFVLFSGRTRSHDGKAKGLSPTVLQALVPKARAAGLSITAHIDTAEDFRHAVEAGVDEITHLPQPDPRVSADLSAYAIDRATAELAAQRGIVVVTTASTTERLSGSALPKQWLGAMRASYAANIRTLSEAGVRLAIGSDGISGERRFATGRDEVLYLAEHKMAGNLALLRMWAREAPRAIFPKRRLGSLGEGDEASFLALAGDPIADIAEVKRITLRVQRGLVLPPLTPIVLAR